MFSLLNKLYIGLSLLDNKRERRSLVLEKSELYFGCLPIFPAYCAVGKWTPLVLFKSSSKPAGETEGVAPFLVLTGDCGSLASAAYSCGTDVSPLTCWGSWEQILTEEWIAQLGSSISLSQRDVVQYLLLKKVTITSLLLYLVTGCYALGARRGDPC